MLLSFIPLLPPPAANRIVSLFSTVFTHEGLSALILPIVLLVLFTSVKYIVGVALSDIDWLDFLAEMAIDLLSIFSAFIIGRYVVKASGSELLINAFTMLFVMAVFAFILCLIRRRIKANYGRSDLSFFRKTGWLIFCEYVVDLACLISIVTFF